MTEQSTTSAVSFIPVSQDDITAFMGKLSRWGATLTQKERALVEVLVARAKGLAPADVKQEQLRTNLLAGVQSVAASSALAWKADGDNVWVRVDPVWYKAGSTEGGEQVEFTARITEQDTPAAAVQVTLAPPTPASPGGTSHVAAQAPVAPAATAAPVSSAAAGAPPAASSATATRAKG